MRGLRHPPPPLWWPSDGSGLPLLPVAHLRAALDLHGAHFVVGPAHGLQRGVVIADLPLAADEVLFLEDSDLGFLVILRGKSRGEGEVALFPGTDRDSGAVSLPTHCSEGFLEWEVRPWAGVPKAQRMGVLGRGVLGWGRGWPGRCQ